MKENTNKYEVKVITKKGEQILIDAEDFGFKKKTIWWLSTPSNLKRNKKNRIIAIKIEED